MQYRDLSLEQYHGEVLVKPSTTAISWESTVERNDLILSIGID